MAPKNVYKTVFSAKSDQDLKKSIEVVEGQSNEKRQKPWYFIRIVVDYGRYKRSLGVNIENFQTICDFIWAREMEDTDVLRLEEGPNKRIFVTPYTTSDYYLTIHNDQGIDSVLVLAVEDDLMLEVLEKAKSFRKKASLGYIKHMDTN
jgi:hypothetical protein